MVAVIVEHEAGDEGSLAVGKIMGYRKAGAVSASAGTFRRHREGADEGT